MARPSSQSPSNGSKGELVLVERGFTALTTQAEDAKEVIALNLGNGSLTPQDLPTIKMPTGGGLSWTVPDLDGDKLEKEIEGIIVYWREPRAYWALSMEQGGGNTPPDCTSARGIEGAGAFGRGSQGNPTGLCVKCPMSQWKTGKNDRGQACKQFRVLFVLFPGEMLPTAVRLAPTSIRAAKSYFMRLSSKGIPYYAAITKLNLQEAVNPEKIKYAVANLSLVKTLAREEAMQVKAYHEMMRGALDVVAVDMTGAAQEAEETE